MNNESVECRNVGGHDALEQPGDFHIWPLESQADGAYFIKIWLPGEGSPGTIPINSNGPNRPDEGNNWGWDGNREKPTLTPSINAIGIWHGYLRNGRLESC